MLLGLRKDLAICAFMSLKRGYVIELSLRYRASLEAIRKTNSVSGDTIKIGQNSGFLRAKPMTEESYERKIRHFQ